MRGAWALRGVSLADKSFADTTRTSEGHFGAGFLNTAGVGLGKTLSSGHTAVLSGGARAVERLRGANKRAVTEMGECRGALALVQTRDTLV